MLEQVFGSKTRVKMMKVFLENPEKRFFVRELTRLTDCLINSVRRELENLLEIGFVVIEDQNGKIMNFEQEKCALPEAGPSKGINRKKYFRLNKNNLFIKEFEALFARGRFMVEKKFTDRLLKAGDVRYLALNGFFVDNSEALTDLLIIGDKLDKPQLQAVIKSFEKKIHREINYTLMDLPEYQLRKDIADRFLNDIIQDEKSLVLFDDLKIKNNGQEKI